MSAALTVSTQFYSVSKYAEIIMNGVLNVVSLEDLAFASFAKDARGRPTVALTLRT